MNPISTQSFTDWETLFENVTEALSGYEAAVAEIGPSAWGPGSGSLFLRCFSDRARVRQALALMHKNAPPKAYQGYRDKVERRLERCESQLEQVLASEGRHILGLFAADGECAKILVELDRRIERLIRAFKDWFLVHDPEEPLEDGLADRTFDAIALLTDCHRISEDPPQALNDIASFEAWRSRLLDIEKRLEIDFGYLEPASAMMRRMADREFPVDCWWFMREAQISDAPDPLKLPEFCKAKQAETPFQGDADDMVCPQLEQVIAYALHELDQEDRKAIRHHVYGCPKCLRLVLEVRAAEHETLEEGAPDVRWATYRQSILAFRSAAEGVGLKDRPSEAVWAAVRRRFHAVLDWSGRFITKDTTTLLEVLLAVPFRKAILPKMASNHEGERLVAKWVQQRDHHIEGIRPTVLLVHRIDETTTSLTISAELSETLPSEPNDVRIVFGWQLSDGSVHVVDPQWFERKDQFIAVQLQKPSAEMDWKNLHVMVVVNG